MNIPIVTLDKIYITPDENNIYFLDCTRVSGTNEIISRKNESIDKQIERISESLIKKEIILADDVIFSGNVLKNIIYRFNLLGIRVVGVIGCICTNEAYEYFNKNLRYGIRTNYLMSDEVIDQICERDFYFGIAGSGIMINTIEGLYKAPYFKPYGNPYERSSIPREWEIEFSRGCLERSIYLWEEIEKLKGAKVIMRELPEKIIYTSENEEIVRILRREKRRL